MKRFVDAFHSFKLFRDYAVLAGGQLGSKLLVFVAFAYLARVLDPVSYGGIEYVAGLAVFFAAIVDGGLSTIGVRLGSADPGRMERLAFQIPVARLLLALICAPVMVATAAIVMGAQVPVALAVAFAAGLFTMPWRQDWALQVTERMTESAVARIIASAVFAGGVLLLVRGPEHLALVGWMDFASLVAAMLFSLYIQHRFVTPVRLSGSFEGFWPVVKEGMVVSSTNLVWALIQTLPLLLIGAFANGLQIALFAAAARVASSVLTFSQMYHFNLFPTLSRAAAGDKTRMAELLRGSFRVVSWGGVFCALAVTLFAEELTRLAFGEKLAGAAPYLAVLIWSFPVVLWSGHARYALTALGKQRQVFIAHVAGLAVLAAACLGLGRWLGPIGYAWGAAAGPFAIWLVAHVYAARSGTTPPPFQIAARPALAAALILFGLSRLKLGYLGDLVGLTLFAMAGPILDPRLLGAIGYLGRAKTKEPPE